MELAHHYAAMDVFVHFGTEETFGQTIQEAKASGVAVVAPNCGGPTELIENGITGLLVDPGERLGYRSAVSRLLDPAVRLAMAESAASSVSDKSWAKNNALLLDYYREAMSDVHARRAAEFELA